MCKMPSHFNMNFHLSISLFYVFITSSSSSSYSLIFHFALSWQRDLKRSSFISHFMCICGCDVLETLSHENLSWNCCYHRQKKAVLMLLSNGSHKRWCQKFAYKFPKKISMLNTLKKNFFYANFLFLHR